MYTTTKYIHNKRVARVTSPLPPSSFSSPPPPPPLFPRSRRCIEEPTNRPSHPTETRNQACPASQPQTLEECNGTQVQGRPRAQSRPGARGQHNRAALPCEYERTSACLAWCCCCCCTCSEEVHHSTHNFKRGSKKSGSGAGNPGCILGFVIRRVGALQRCVQ
jgi:hypothetical protein